MQHTIESAMRAIQTKYQVGEASAYTILVQASIDGHTNVREAATRILDDTRRDASHVDDAGAQ